MNTDGELLWRYASEGAEAAFDELVRRYVDLVYSAAVRSLNGDLHRAEDVTQEVFVELAQQSRSLAKHPALVGWLYVAARRMALRAIRTEQRRNAREEALIQMSEIERDSVQDNDWKRVSQELDAAMEQLRAADRVAILLRFFQNQSFHEVGAALGLRENAARMRVDRALEKLRRELLRRGVGSTVGALATALLSNASLAAPPVFVETLTPRCVARAAALSSASAGIPLIFLKWAAVTKTQIAGTATIILAAALVFLAARSQWRANEKGPPDQTAITIEKQGFTGVQGPAENLAMPGDGERAPAQEDVAASAVDKEVSAIIADWEGLPSIFDDAEIYTQQMRRLAEIGPPATPLLSTALERTSRDAPLRLIPFAMRVIGDPRAVPSLIRTIPKTLRPPSSDCGVNVPDRGLLSFMQAHDVAAVEGTSSPRARDFDMARPVREVAASLRNLTGTQLNEADVFHTSLDGGEQQRAAQRKAYYDVATNWAKWWKTNAYRFATDLAAADLDVRIPKPSAAPPLSADQFLAGPNVQFTGSRSGSVLSPVEAGTDNGIQLALGRKISVPPAIVKNSVGLSGQRLQDWAREAGADLLAVQYTDSDSGKVYYALKGIELRAWEVSAESWNSIEKTIQGGGFPAMERPASDLLMHYDEDQQRYRPEKKAAFVFMTRDGLQGILRITAQVTEPMNPRQLGMMYVPPDESGPDQRIESGSDRGVQFDYRFWHIETEESKREVIARHGARAAGEASRKERKMTRLFQAHPKLLGAAFLPNGQPADGAQILLEVPGEGAVLGQNGFANEGYVTMVEAMVDGAFTLPRVPTARRIYAAHKDGFAEFKIEDEAAPLFIRLAPWGRIEGTVFRQGKPAPHETLALAIGYTPPGTALTLGHYQTVSDDQGHFTFTNLPPGEVQVCRFLNGSFYAGQFAKVVAGETTSIRHGFDGRTVRGRLMTSDGHPANWRKDARVIFKLKQLVRSLHEGSNQQRVTRMPALVSEVGEFRIEDVPPGVYNLQAELLDSNSSGPAVFRTTTASFKQELVVPEGKDDLDIGDIIVEKAVRSSPSASPVY